MKINVGDTDRLIRAFLAGAILAIGLLVPMGSPVLQIVLVLLGAALITTATLRFCPVYLPFKFSTKK